MTAGNLAMIDLRTDHILLLCRWRIVHQLKFIRIQKINVLKNNIIYDNLLYCKTLRLIRGVVFVNRMMDGNWQP